VSVAELISIRLVGDGPAEDEGAAGIEFIAGGAAAATFMVMVQRAKNATDGRDKWAMGLMAILLYSR
jgi:hypothetical protein